jgi:hypothetical protein
MRSLWLTDVYQHQSRCQVLRVFMPAPCVLIIFSTCEHIVQVTYDFCTDSVNYNILINMINKKGRWVTD